MKILLFANFWLCLISVSYTSKLEKISLIPTAETISIYENEKRNILSFYLSTFKNHSIKPNKRVSMKLTDSFDILKQLTPAELIKAMLMDGSDYFLIILLYGLRERYTILIFHDVRSLQPSNDRNRFKSTKRIFRNFRIFLSQAIADSKPSDWEKSVDSSAGRELLILFNNFWQGRLKPLARKILIPDDFKIWKQFIEDRLLFCEIFLSRKTEELFISTNRDLVREIERGIFKATPALQNFYFLYDYFTKHMGNVKSPNFLLYFEWLALQSPFFLINFLNLLRDEKYGWYVHYPDREILLYQYSILKGRNIYRIIYFWQMGLHFWQLD
jgi:hypothetical protein